MDLPHLTAYITRKNQLEAVFCRAGLVPIVYSIHNPDDLRTMASYVGMELEPERLSCDGELTGTALKVKRAGLMMVARDLLCLGVKV